MIPSGARQRNLLNKEEDVMKKVHTVCLASLLAAGFMLIRCIPLTGAWASSGEATTVHAAGRGHPWINLRDGHDLPTAYEVQRLERANRRRRVGGGRDFDQPLVIRVALVLTYLRLHLPQGFCRNFSLDGDSAMLLH